MSTHACSPVGGIHAHAQMKVIIDTLARASLEAVTWKVVSKKFKLALAPVFLARTVSIRTSTSTCKEHLLR